MYFLPGNSNFSKHLKHLRTCDKYGNKPYLRGIQNHMAIAPEMMELWYLVQANQVLCHIPGVEEALKRLDEKLDALYKHEY